MELFQEVLWPSVFNSFGCGSSVPFLPHWIGTAGLVLLLLLPFAKERMPTITF